MLEAKILKLRNENASLKEDNKSNWKLLNHHPLVQEDAQMLTITKYTYNFISFLSEQTNEKRSFVERQMNDTLSDNEWYNEWQRMTSSSYFG